MKAALKVSGIFDLSNEDLFEILKDYALTKRESLKPIIVTYVRETYGYTPARIEFPASGVEKIKVFIDSPLESGVKIRETPRTRTEHSPRSTRKWNGFYDAVGEIVSDFRKKKKNFIGFDSLREELLSVEDGKGKPKFVVAGEEIPMKVIKHRLAPSQIVRQAKHTPDLKGVKVSKKDQGLQL